jgi:DNA repair exonuclease SbcCD ATPase subunit
MSSTELVKSSTEALEQLNRRLAELKAKSEIAIVDSDTLVKSAEAKLEFESYIRSVEAHFEPELAPAEETVARCKLAMSQLISPVKGWLKSLVERQKNYHAEEKRKAEAEQRRINEEARREAERKAEEERRERERIAAEQRKEQELQAARNKRIRDQEIEDARKAGELNKREAERLKKEAEQRAAAERKAAAEREEREKAQAAEDAKAAAADVPEVTVLPNLPKGAGLPKNQTYYYAEVTDANEIIRAYNTAILNADGKRIAFLARFIQVDEQEVGKFARDTKDCAKAASLLPGVKFTSKG